MRFTPVHLYVDVMQGYSERRNHVIQVCQTCAYVMRCFAGGCTCNTRSVAGAGSDFLISAVITY